MVRATKSGLSGAVDAFGRTLAVTDHFSPGAQIMIVQVPLRHVSTIYARVRGSVCLVVRREPPDHDSCSTASRSVSASV
jgi:apolipoprotein N-acyltransferase